MFTLLVALSLGYVIGLLQKGIKIKIENTEKPVEFKKYNESTASLLPEEIRKYMEQNNGYINH